MDLDFEVNRASKDRVPVEAEQDQTLVPAEVTTAAPAHVEDEEHVFGKSRPLLADHQAEFSVDSVFAKLKDLKVKE